MSELPPLPELPGNECIPLSLIRYVPGYTKSFVQEYATAYARACLASAPTIQPTQPVQEREPVAWMVPEIMSFKGVKFTSCPKEAQEVIEGAVGWSASMIGDMPPVTDKHGVTHYPKPLYATPAQAGDAGEPSDGERDDTLCGHCDGSGTVLAVTGHLGPDDYEYEAQCEACWGTGSSDLRDAINALSYQPHSVTPGRQMVHRADVLRIIAARATKDQP